MRAPLQVCTNKNMHIYVPYVNTNEQGLRKKPLTLMRGSCQYVLVQLGLEPDSAPGISSTEAQIQGTQGPP